MNYPYSGIGYREDSSARGTHNIIAAGYTQPEHIILNLNFSWQGLSKRNKARPTV